MEWVRRLLKERGYVVRDGSFWLQLNVPTKSIGCVENYSVGAVYYTVELETPHNARVFNLHTFMMDHYFKEKSGKRLGYSVSFTLYRFKETCEEFIKDADYPRANEVVAPIPAQEEDYSNADEEDEESADDEQSEDDPMEYDEDGWQIYEESSAEDLNEPVEFKYEPVDTTPAPEPSVDCVVCMEEISWRVVFVPCGHANFCQTCAQRLDQCPTCRSKITSKVKLFL